MSLPQTLADQIVAYVSQKERDGIDRSDFGWPEERKYPAKTRQQFENAVRLLGKAPRDKQALIKRNLTRIARRQGFPLPSSWE